MNRIYQGRISHVDVQGKELPNWPERLWDFHVLFQDAINYYIVALAALGQSPGGKLTLLREQLAAIWEEVRRPGERRPGMREGLARRFGVRPDEFTLERAFAIARDGELPDAIEAEKYTTWIIETRATGESGPRNASREFIPKLCWHAFGGQLEGGGADEAKADGTAQLRKRLREAQSDGDILALAAECELSWVVKLKTPGEEWPSAGERLRKSVLHFLKEFEQPPQKQAGAILASKTRAWLRAYSGAEDKLNRLLKSEIPGAAPAIPKNAKGVADRTEALLLFKYFPQRFTFDLLKFLFPPLSAPKGRAKKAAAAPTGADARRARGARGYVFRAFTTFPFFGSNDANDFGSSGWKKELDIVAFKEALTAVSQFRRNIEKRQEKIRRLSARLLLMAGEEAIGEAASSQVKNELAQLWGPSTNREKLEQLAVEAGEEEEDSNWPNFIGDKRIAELRRIVDAELADEDGGPYGLRERTTKGWSVIRRKWRTIVKQGTPFSAEKRDTLRAALDQLRAEKPEEVGAHRLFEALTASEDAWAIWREPTEADGAAIAEHYWEADDPLAAFQRYCETREELEERVERHVRLTPADPTRSRRLFSFTDACGSSFGKRKGELKHDQDKLAVTVPVALADERGCFRKQTARIYYSSPRLLRDRLRSSDGKYTKTWSQPMADALWGQENPPKQSDDDLNGAAVELMPDWGRDGRVRFLLNISPVLSAEKLAARVRTLRGQDKVPEGFALAASGRSYIRWPNELGDPPKLPWWEHLNSFSVLGVDLGVRQAAATALIEVKSAHANGPNTRGIGDAGGKSWCAKYRAGTLLRLAGEDRKVWRKPTKGENGHGPAFREELYGSRGRSADQEETRRAAELIRGLGYDGLAEECKEFSFPKQNDQLLVAVRWAQRRIARQGRWSWMLSEADKVPRAIEEIGKDEPELAKLAYDVQRLRADLQSQTEAARGQIQSVLLETTERILPVRGRSWEFVAHPDAQNFPGCRLLRLTPPGAGARGKRLAGQRGLSMARVAQLADLRRRWQSLNQTLRRPPGERPLTAAQMREVSVPDPCPDLLRKLDQVREQRVNQTAHLILAEALGVRLRAPEDSRNERAKADRHGEYERFREPVDAIVIENLTRYRTTQGRSRSENTRLMQWCHRQVSNKLQQLAEAFGVPVLETPAPYSSLFCSRTGAIGFRAVEVAPADRALYRWRKLLSQAAEKGAAPQEEARHALALFQELETLNAGRTKATVRTLLAPQPGGPIFVSAVSGARAPMQADLNAAINLALRAVAAPGCVAIHQRMRTERRGDIQLVTREKRRFGSTTPEVIAEGGKPLGKERHTNLFFDPAHVAKFGRARLNGEKSYEYATWVALKERVQQTAWQRCAEVNRERKSNWQSRAAAASGEVF